MKTNQLLIESLEQLESLQLKLDKHKDEIINYSARVGDALMSDHSLRSQVQALESNIKN